MDCPEAIDLMDEALEDRLGTRLRPNFQEHLVECRPCNTYYEQLKLTRSALGSLPRGSTSPRRNELIEEFKKEFESDRDQ